MGARHELTRTALAWWLAAALVGVGCGDETTLDDARSEAEESADEDEERDEDASESESEDDSRESDDDGRDESTTDDDDDGEEKPVESKRDAAVKADAGAQVDASEDDASDEDEDEDEDDGAGSDSGATDDEEDTAGGTSSPDDAEVPEEKADLGEGDGKDVIAIGDSWMSLFGTGIQQSLVKVSGQPYRTYGVPGTKLLDEVIPRQYASAKRADPDIKTVVMTGGGNDILLGGGFADAKTVIDNVAKRLDELWTEMGSDGVEDVVYIEYSEGGNNGENVRYGIEKVGPVCKNHTAVRCHFLLSDPIIMKRLRDGIHPTDDGYDKLGKAVYDLMVEEGMRR